MAAAARPTCPTRCATTTPRPTTTRRPRAPPPRRPPPARRPGPLGAGRADGPGLLKRPDPGQLADVLSRGGVGIALLDPRHHVLVAHRLEMPSAAWELPDGGIEAGQPALQLAWREMAEEI